MPLQSQMLYILLNFEADNYGFLSSTRSTIKRCGAAEEDLENLIINGYLLQLTKDVYVITHWFIHNKEDRRAVPSYEEFNQVELKNKQYYIRDTFADPQEYRFISEREEI